MRRRAARPKAVRPEADERERRRLRNLRHPFPDEVQREGGAQRDPDRSWSDRAPWPGRGQGLEAPAQVLDREVREQIGVGIRVRERAQRIHQRRSERDDRDVRRVGDPAATKFNALAPLIAKAIAWGGDVRSRPARVASPAFREPAVRLLTVTEVGPPVSVALRPVNVTFVPVSAIRPGGASEVRRELERVRRVVGQQARRAAEGRGLGLVVARATQADERRRAGRCPSTGSAAGPTSCWCRSWSSWRRSDMRRPRPEEAGRRPGGSDPRASAAFA